MKTLYNIFCTPFTRKVWILYIGYEGKTNMPSGARANSYKIEAIGLGFTGVLKTHGTKAIGSVEKIKQSAHLIDWNV